MKLEKLEIEFFTFIRENVKSTAEQTFATQTFTFIVSRNDEIGSR